MTKSLCTALPLALSLALGLTAVHAQTRSAANRNTQPRDPRGNVRYPSDTMGFAKDNLPLGAIRYGSPEFYAQQAYLQPVPADQALDARGSTGNMSTGREPSSPYRSNPGSGQMSPNTQGGNRSQGTTGTGDLNNNRMDRGTSSPSTSTPANPAGTGSGTMMNQGPTGTSGTQPSGSVGSPGTGNTPAGAPAGSGVGGTGNQGSVGTGQSPARNNPPATATPNNLPAGSNPSPPNEMTTPAGTGSNTARPDSNRTGGGQR